MKRSRWKGFYIKPEHLKETSTFSRVSRSSTIIPKFSGHTFKVHNGQSFREVTVTKEMLGYKFGEFSRTRSEFAFKKKKKKKK